MSAHLPAIYLLIGFSGTGKYTVASRESLLAVSHAIQADVWVAMGYAAPDNSLTRFGMIGEPRPVTRS